MAGLLRAVRMLGDEARVRILRLLEHEELSVAELQEVLGMGQSRISMQLSQLKQAGLVAVRKAGQKSLYRYTPPPGAQDAFTDLIRQSGEEMTSAIHDDEGLRLVLQKRKDKLRSYFDGLAGRFGRNYVPGRSWKGTAEMLLKLLPPLTIADLGAGEGTLSLLLAQRANRVIAVDNSEKMIEYGTDVASRNGVKNLEFRLGDLEELPLTEGEADLALLHQSLHHAIHPQTALQEAYRIVCPGGRVIVMDLLKHSFEEARELYADVWLGFTQAELMRLLLTAGFENPDISIAHRQEEFPHFETVLAIAGKPR